MYIQSLNVSLVLEWHLCQECQLIYLCSCVHYSQSDVYFRLSNFLHSHFFCFLDPSGNVDMDTIQGGLETLLLAEGME